MNTLKQTDLNNIVQRVTSQSNIASITGATFVIDTTNATYLESPDKTYHSYTFHVKNTTKNTGLENVFFSLMPDGSYKTFLAHYDITDDEINHLELGGEITLANRWDFIEINQDQIATQNARVFFDSASGCWKRETRVSDMCGSNLHDSGQIGICEDDDKPDPYRYFNTIISCNAIVGQGTTPQGDTTNPENTGHPDSGAPFGGGKHSSVIKSPVPENILMDGQCADALAISEILRVLGIPDIPETRDCLEDSNKCEQVRQLNNYTVPLKSSAPSFSAAVSFGNLAASAICNDDEVDFEDEQIIESEPFELLDEDQFSIEDLNDECALNVLSKLIGINTDGINSGYINSIRNVFNSDNNVTLKIVNDVVPEGIASTDFDTDININSGVYIIEITLSNDYLNSTPKPTKLSIASLIFHEMLHAKLMYQYLNGTLLINNPSFEDLNVKFANFLADRNEVNATLLANQMHIDMTNFTSSMGYALYIYAQDQNMSDVTKEYCKEVMKGSFKGTPAMPLINTGNENTTNNLIEKFNNEQENNINAKGNDC